MSNAVQFLEALSLDARKLSEESYTEAVAAENFDPGIREALLKRDAKAISRLLGGRATVLAFVFPAEEEPDSDGKDGDQPDDGETEIPQHDQENALAA